MVWVVFYWILTGVGFVVAGLFLTFAASFASGMVAAMEELRRSRPSTSDALRGELVWFLGLLSMHMGLVTLVTCHGLWTFRRWGLSVAKVLAIVFLVLGIFGVVASLITRAAVVANLVSTLISAGVMVYLFGSANLTEGIRSYAARLRPQVATPEWERFE